MMRSLAAKQPSNDFAKPKNGDRGRGRSISSLSTGMPLLQRQCACGGGCPRCKEELGMQTKLKISEPGDKYEQEADLIADEVMRMPEPFVQRQIEGEEEEEEMVQRKMIDKPVASSVPTQESSEVLPIVHEVLNSAGQPLDRETRSFMEPRFDYDFSHVRVHTNPKAAQSAQAVNANAYTVGHKIVFGADRFAPETDQGRRLIAHELTHVMQQDSGMPQTIQRDTPSIEQRAQILPEQLRSAESSIRGEADDLPQTPGAPVPRSSRRICGPDISRAIASVWSQVQSDFRSWSLPDQRNACLYLIQLFTPQTTSGAYAPPGSSLPVALNKNGFDTLGLFQVGAGWQRRRPYFPCCGVPGTAARRGANDFDPGHEDPGRCSNAVTVGGQCWLMGTVNYGAFGVMMKLCHDLLPASEGAIIGEQMFASIERYIEQIQRSGQTIGQDVGAVVRLVVHELLRQLGSALPEASAVVEEVVQYIINSPSLVRRLGTAGAAGQLARDLADAAIAALLRSGALRRAGSAIGGALGPTQLFSRSSVTAFVAGYKIFDGDDPGPPLRWALATFDSGPSATPSSGNRSTCDTTCPLTYSGTPFDYVWEPTKPRRSWSSTSPAISCPSTHP